MPILKKEPEIFPAALLTPEYSDLRPWYAAHVRSRREKSLARHLRDSQIPHYLPQRTKQQRYGGKMRISYLPLFPGYVFLRADPYERVEARRTNLICNILDVLDQALLESELADLWRLQQSGAPLVSHPYLEPGDEVEVRAGSMTGYRGVVLRAKGKLRLVVSITLLRRSVAVELDRDVLAPTHRVGERLRAAS